MIDRSDLKLRRAGPADAAEIASMSRAFREELGEPADLLSEEAVRRDGFGEDPEFEVFLAEHSGESIGYALFFKSYDPTYAEAGFFLADLYVKPQARRRGVARALMAAVIAHARRRGRAYVWWVSMVTNKNAAAFYQSLGVATVQMNAYAATRSDSFEKLAQEALPVEQE